MHADDLATRASTPTPRPRRRTGRLGAVAGVALVLGLAGCGAEVASDRVAAQITDQFELQVGQRPDSVTCPEDLPAEAGESVRCTVTADGKTFGVTASVASAEGEESTVDIQVDPPGVAPGR